MTQPAAIIIDAEPRAYEFARNAFGFKVTGCAGRHYRAEISPLAPALGDTITLRWKDQEHVFTFVAAADSSGTQLTVIDNSHGETLAADFLKNASVAEAWTITALPWAIKFYEKTSGEYIPLFIETSKPTCVAITHFNSLEYAFFSKCCAELKILLGGSMVSRGKSFLSFVNGKATVEMGPKLLPIFGEDSLAPNQTAVHTCAAVLTYSVDFYEFNPTLSPAYQNMAASATLHALDGILPYAQAADFALPTPIFPLTTLFTDTRTWREAHQEVTLLAVAATTVTFTAKLYFTDGTDATHSILASTNMLEASAYAIPCGFNDLGLNAYEVDGLEVYRYEVIASSGFSASFTLMDKPFLGKVLRYRNYKGGWQSLLCEGTEVRKAKTTQTIGETKPVVGHASTTPTVFKTTGDISDTNELNLGLFYNEEMSLVRDLLQSRFVYRQVGAAWKRIHITSESIELTNENEDLMDAKIEFIYATPC